MNICVVMFYFRLFKINCKSLDFTNYYTFINYLQQCSTSDSQILVKCQFFHLTQNMKLKTVNADFVNVTAGPDAIAEATLPPAIVN